MAINPIDVIRTQEASTFKQMENARAHHVHDQINKDFQNLVEREQNKPKETTKADNMEYRYDAKEKGNNQYYGSGGKKKEKKEEEKKESKQQSKKHGFDIMI